MDEGIRASNLTIAIHRVGSLASLSGCGGGLKEVGSERLSRSKMIALTHLF